MGESPSNVPDAEKFCAICQKPGKEHRHHYQYCPVCRVKTIHIATADLPWTCMNHCEKPQMQIFPMPVILP